VSEDLGGIKVLLTGFGPFRDHVVNSSWQSVRRIPDRGIKLPSNIQTNTPVHLMVYELPVIYTTIAKVIPELWKKHQPDVS
jgi:pyroglutamyl-peptidase